MPVGTTAKNFCPTLNPL